MPEIKFDTRYASKTLSILKEWKKRHIGKLIIRFFFPCWSQWTIRWNSPTFIFHLITFSICTMKNFMVTIWTAKCCFNGRKKNVNSNYNESMCFKHDFIAFEVRLQVNASIFRRMNKSKYNSHKFENWNSQYSECIRKNRSFPFVETFNQHVYDSYCIATAAAVVYAQ